MTNAAARTHLVEDSKLVADGALGDLGEGDDEGADVAVQLQAAQLVEALHPQRCLHPLHHLLAKCIFQTFLAGIHFRGGAKGYGTGAIIVDVFPSMQWCI